MEERSRHGEDLEDEKEQHLLQMSEISLWLDTYDDIFSDFDPRPYSQRALSEDFLDESRKASRDKASGSFELKLLIPKKKRDRHDEAVIRKRLRGHFEKHFEEIKSKRMDFIFKQGVPFILLGIVLMLIATYMLFTQNSERSMMVSFLIVLVEPAGWFLFWEGLNQVIFESRKLNPVIELYMKFAS